ncbi:MAG: SHOCT domain-containing protein [Clostridiaceae bacterium]
MGNAYQWMNNMMFNRRVGNNNDFNRVNACFFPLRMIGMLIFTALIILVIYLLLRNRRPYRGNNVNENEAMIILRTRFARSEISEEEFIQKKELLQKKVK